MIPLTPTPAAWAADLDRGPCGHILCAHANHCLQDTTTTGGITA